MKTIEFSNQVYSIQNIRKVISVYKGYAEISIRESGNRIYVTFRKCRFSEERTVREFENYLIGIENSNEGY